MYVADSHSILRFVTPALSGAERRQADGAKALTRKAMKLIRLIVIATETRRERKRPASGSCPTQIMSAPPSSAPRLIR
jgi:hypothetical protein